MGKLNYQKVNMKLLTDYAEMDHGPKKRAIEEKLVALNEKMVHKKAHQWAKNKNIPIPFDELQQLAYWGLIKAIRKFDPSKNCQFSTFAYRHIDGSVMRYIRDRVSFVRIPQTLQGRGEGKVPVGSIKIISLDVEDSLLQIEKEYGIAEVSDNVEQLLKECSQINRPRKTNLREAFISQANYLIDKGLINAERIKGDSFIRHGVEHLQMTLL